MPWKVRPGWVPAFVFGLGILLLLPSVWSETSITGQDEYWLSFRTPMEMRDRGDWLTPWVNGEPRLRKPPLLYWAILLSYKLFGVHLLSARIWGVVSGAGLAACACLFSRELFQSNGLLAGLLALATIGVAVEGRRAMLDLPSALFSTLAVLYFVKWLRATASTAAAESCHLTGRRSPVLLCGLSLGLSFMTKGPVGFLFFTAGALAGAAAFRLRSPVRLNWWQLWPGLVVLAAVCLPWPLAMQHLWSEKFGKIIGEELTARQFGRWTPGSPLSAWSGALGLVLPWTPLMLMALYSLLRQPTTPPVREKRFLVGWFVLGAVPFFFMRSFERYMLALVPAQIALCAQWLEQEQTNIRRTTLRLCVLLLAGISVLICLFAWWFKLAVWTAAASLLLTGFVVFLAFRLTHPHWLAFFAGLLFTCVLGGIYPRFGINALPAALASELAPYPVSLFDAPQPSLLSMRLGRSLQAFDAERLRVASTPDSMAEIVFVDHAHRAQFLSALQKQQLHGEEKGRFRTFYSRQAWIRFVRPGATWEDWETALRTRSLDGLKSEFDYYLVKNDVVAKQVDH